MKKVTAAGLVVAGLTVLGCFVACHSFSTVKESTDASTQTSEIALSGNRVNGLMYYLPRGRIRITGDFKSTGGDGGPSDARKSPASSRASLAAGVAGAPSGGDVTEQKNFVVTIAADIEADPSARYYLKPVRNYFYDDDIKLTVNAKHLLSTGNATAEDQTARIISTTAGLVAQVAMPGKPPAPGITSREIPQQITVLELLREIEDAVIEGRVSIGDKTSVSSEAIKQLGNALPGLYKPPPELSPDEEEENIQAALAALYVKDTITLKNIRDLLRLYPSRFRK